MPSSTLHIHYKDTQNKTHTISCHSTERKEWLIGRRDEIIPDINLSWDQKVGRIHAKIYYRYQCWYIKQLHPRAPTFLNQVHVPEEVELEIPLRAELIVGNTSLLVQNPHAEVSPNGRIRPFQPLEYPSQTISETARLDILTKVHQLIANQGVHMLDLLVTELRTLFPSANHLGIAIYDDIEIVVPAYYPRGSALISFNLAREALLKRKQSFLWDRELAEDHYHQYSSLNDILQAIYVPVIRRSQEVAILYLHTLTRLTDKDLALLNCIGEVLGHHQDFEPETEKHRLPSVFISYAREDQTDARKVVKDLRRQRLSVWLDDRMHIGEDWQKKLGQAIRASDAFALIMSPDSLASSAVIWEIEEARKSKTPIYPLLLHPCDTIPADLSARHYLRLDDDYASAILGLVGELNRQDRSVQKHTAMIQNKILFLPAGMHSIDKLSINAEAQAISEQISPDGNDDHQWEVQKVWPTSLVNLEDFFLETKPRWVHISAYKHDYDQLYDPSIMAIPRPLKKEEIQYLFQHCAKDVEGVVLSGCYTAEQIQEIAIYIPNVVGIPHSVTAEAQLVFIKAFYRRLLHQKTSVQIAFNLGSISARNVAEQLPPLILLKKETL